MTQNMGPEEGELVDRAIEWLTAAVPSAWSVQRSNWSVAGSNLPQPQSLADDAIDVRGPNTAVTFIVEGKRSFSARDAERMFSGRIPRTLRALNSSTPILVISEWLSPRTRELLEEQRVNYLDLTGNALIRLDYPVVFIRSAGAIRAPKSAARGQVRLRGAKAGRVVRLLLDVRPPYGVRELAAASGVAVSYVSRLLDSLDRDALLERTARGRVESVDVARLLRRWAESYDVFTTNQATAFLGPKGTKDVMERVWSRGQTSRARVAITGSFAAVRIAPVAAPRLLILYADQTEELAALLGLLPADEGSNVVLLDPYDPVVWNRNSYVEGQRFVAASQTAIDCLSGNGRMPAEGEALVAWMVENESVWRIASLDKLPKEEGS